MQIPQWQLNVFLEDCEFNLKEKGLFIYIVTKMKNGSVFLSAEIIANDSNCGASSIYSGINKLIRRGLLNKKKHKNGKTEYTLGDWKGYIGGEEGFQSEDIEDFEEVEIYKEGGYSWRWEVEHAK